MRSYGRINQINGIGGQWVEVQTDANGLSDQVYLTTLIQTLRLNLGESPFYASYGLPAHQSVTTQVFPDYYVAQTQTQFAPYFASLAITRIHSYKVNGVPTPAYNVNVVTHNGAVIGLQISTGQTVVPE